MNKLIFLTPLLCLISSNGLAGTMGEVQEIYKNVITLSGGPAWTSSGRSQIINLEPDLIKAYQANKKKSTLGSGELFLGLQRSLNPTIIYQFGIAFAASSSAKLSGSVWDEADPRFDNFFYNYKISHTQVTAKGKLLAGTNVWIQPYVSGSVGVGFNRANHFVQNPKIVEQLTPPGFISHTISSFSYTAGGGLQKAINPHLSAGVGYEFADWGKSKLSRSISQTIGSGIKLNHLYTHQLQFSLSYNL